MKIQPDTKVLQNAHTSESDAQSTTGLSRISSQTAASTLEPASLHHEPQALTHYAFRSAVDSSAAPNNSQDPRASGLPLPVTASDRSRAAQRSSKLKILGGIAGAAVIGAGLGSKLVNTNRALQKTQTNFDSQLAQIQIASAATDATIQTLQGQIQALISQGSTAAAHSTTLQSQLENVTDNAWVMNDTLYSLTAQLGTEHLYGENLYKQLVDQNNTIIRMSQTLAYPPLTLADLSNPPAQPSQDPSDRTLGSWTTKLTNLFPHNRALPSDVNEHGLGECDGDAAFSALALQYPDAISSMITDNYDGTYAVNMFDPDNNPIIMHVDNKFLTDSDGNLVQTGGIDYTPNWVTLLSKAVSKYNSIYMTGPTDNFRLGGIWYYQVLGPLFGNGTRDEVGAGQKSPAEALTFINEQKEAGAIIVCNMWGNATTASDEAKDALIAGHGYTVLGTYTSAANETSVVMRNPWGVAARIDGSAYDTTEGGTNLLSLSKFATDWYYQSFTPPTALPAANPGETQAFALDLLQESIAYLPDEVVCSP